MWDDRRKVGILNDFDLAKLADQAGATGQDNTGTLPFMALDLLKRGLCGEIARRYRHDAESFAWCLVCLYLSIVEGVDGNNYTRNPHPLPKWFQDCRSSLESKLGFLWRDDSDPDISLVHSNTRSLALALHKFWLDRYNEQFPKVVRAADEVEREAVEYEGFLAEILDMEKPGPTEVSPHEDYKEPEDEPLFRKLLTIYGRELRRLEAIKGVVVGMIGAYKGLDWSD